MTAPAEVERLAAELVEATARRDAEAARYLADRSADPLPFVVAAEVVDRARDRLAGILDAHPEADHRSREALAADVDRNRRRVQRVPVLVDRWPGEAEAEHARRVRRLSDDAAARLAVARCRLTDHDRHALDAAGGSP